ncbi:MAG: GNAT family N-acetyltransferase [Oscillospiraceae bacterium]|nr:GNAT family N-acetyltransferase [Oscillospiraceae bacterium]
MTKRQATKGDLEAVLELYKHLNVDPIPEVDESLTALWDDILADKNHRILLIEVAGKAVATCVLLLVPNLTRGARPYAIVENVVTLPDERKKGYGKAVLDYAAEIARSANCYKISLMTGRKDAPTLRFYENAGFNRNDKTAFIKWWH